MAAYCASNISTQNYGYILRLYRNSPPRLHTVTCSLLVPAPEVQTSPNNWLLQSLTHSQQEAFCKGQGLWANVLDFLDPPPIIYFPWMDMGKAPCPLPRTPLNSVGTHMTLQKWCGAGELRYSVAIWYRYGYIWVLDRGGGGLFVKLAGIFRCGLNFGKMSFHRDGHVIPF